MVDREARDRILHLIEQGALSDSDLSDIMRTKSKDRAVRTFHHLCHQHCDIDLRRWNLFLRSNSEYRWGRQTELPHWSVLLIPVILPALAFILCLGFVLAEQIQALFAHFGFKTCMGNCLFIIVFSVTVLIFALLDWRHGKATHRDLRVYPFYTRDEYDAATGEGFHRGSTIPTA